MQKNRVQEGRAILAVTVDEFGCFSRKEKKRKQNEVNQEKSVNRTVKKKLLKIPAVA